MTIALLNDAPANADVRGLVVIDDLHALVATAARATDYAEAASADATRRAYASDWRNFAAFCARHGLPALPAAPQTVALYVADLPKRRRIATIRRRLVAINRAHVLAGDI